MTLVMVGYVGDHPGTARQPFTVRARQNEARTVLASESTGIWIGQGQSETPNAG